MEQIEGDGLGEGVRCLLAAQSRDRALIQRFILVRGKIAGPNLGGEEFVASSAPTREAQLGGIEARVPRSRNLAQWQRQLAAICPGRTTPRPSQPDIVH